MQQITVLNLTCNKIFILLFLSILLVKMITAPAPLPGLSLKVNTGEHRLEQKLVTLINDERKRVWNGLSHLDENFHCQQTGGGVGLSSGGYTVISNIAFLYIDEQPVSADVLQCVENGAVSFYITLGKTAECALTFQTGMIQKYGATEKTEEMHLFEEVCSLYPDTAQSKTIIDNWDARHGSGGHSQV